MRQRRQMTSRRIVTSEYYSEQVRLKRLLFVAPPVGSLVTASRSPIFGCRFINQCRSAFICKWAALLSRSWRFVDGRRQRPILLVPLAPVRSSNFWSFSWLWTAYLSISFLHVLLFVLLSLFVPYVECQLSFYLLLDLWYNIYVQLSNLKILTIPYKHCR